MKCTPLGEQKSLWLRKTLLIMKFFVLFLLLGTIPCWAGVAYSQNVKMSLDMENTTVHDVINAIEKKGEFYFTYNLNQINVNRKVSIKVENKTINQILDQLFSKSGIDYKIENSHIVLYKQAASEVEAVKQQKSINGIVADEQGEPIIGASVLEKGTTNGTITDLDGRFTLSIGKEMCIRDRVGDRVMVVGPQDAVERVANLMGNSLKRLDHPNICLLYTSRCV